MKTTSEWRHEWSSAWSRILDQFWADVMVSVRHNRNPHFGYRVLDAKLTVL